MPKQIKPQRPTINCWMQNDPISVELPFYISADAETVHQRVIPHLPANTSVNNVAIFPRSITTESSTLEYDVIVNPVAAQAMHEHQDMKGELAALRKEVRSLTNILLADREEMKAAQLQLGSMSRERMHRNRLMKPKVMIGVLGWLARAFCKLEKNVPVEKYATRLANLLDQKVLPKTLKTEMDLRPYLEKTLTKAAITKIDAAAIVADRDADAHLENMPIVLLASLMDLEQSVFESGVFGPGEEGAELSALRLMLARLGSETANAYLMEIKSNPGRYGAIADGQEERFAKYLKMS